MKLSSVGNCEGCERLWVWFQFHLPESGSQVQCEKMDELALPISLRHSLISFMEYLSMCECWFSCWKFWTIRSPWPCFLGTQKIGELYGELDLLTTPSFNHSSRVCSMNWVCVSGKLNCFLKIGWSSLRWIWCVKSFARPRSYLFRLMAARCLNRVSIYWFRYASCAPRWHLSSISFLVHAFFLTFGSHWWICSQMVARLSSSNGIRVVSSVSTIPRMSPVSRLILWGAQFWSWMVQCLLPSKETHVVGPDISGCFGTPMSANNSVHCWSSEKTWLVPSSWWNFWL